MYLPWLGFTIGVGILVLAAMHVAQHPELLMDVCVAMGAAVPRYILFAVQRLAEAAYIKLFGAAGQSTIMRARITPPPEVELDGQGSLVILLVVLLFGWYLSAVPPARPAD